MGPKICKASCSIPPYSSSLKSAIQSGFSQQGAAISILAKALCPALAISSWTSLGRAELSPHFPAHFDFLLEMLPDSILGFLDCPSFFSTGDTELQVTLAFPCSQRIHPASPSLPWCPLACQHQDILLELSTVPNATPLPTSHILMAAWAQTEHLSVRDGEEQSDA